MNKSLEDDRQKAEKCRGDETNNAFKTMVNEIQYEEVRKKKRLDLYSFVFCNFVFTKANALSIKQLVSASLNIGRRDAAEYIIVEDSHQLSEENVISKEGCPNEFEGKEAGDSSIKLDANTQGEANYGSGKAETTAPEDEVRLYFTFLSTLPIKKIFCKN